MGLFFMTVGMEISAGLFIAKMRTILAGIAGLLLGKVQPRQPLVSSPLPTSSCHT